MTVPNIDAAVVRGFGDEWQRFDQTNLSSHEFEEMFQSYFRIFPWEILPAGAEGFDLGCGSGRWARGVAPRVGKLHCIDPSADALKVAGRSLAGLGNVAFHLAAVDQMPLPDQSMDFGYCLGVLHHIPDTWAGLRHAVSKLRKGAPLLLYIYYAFDNRPRWYFWIWRVSDVLRRVLAGLPLSLRYGVSQLLAAFVYFPLARTARLLSRLGVNVKSFPLSWYGNHSFYTMRTDALDRFGTRLEKRFSRVEIERRMIEAGLTNIVFSETAPYWCAVGVRA